MNGNLAEQRINGEYTYEDYLSWDTDERYEIIDGWAYLMAAPNEEHHDISMALSRKIADFLDGKPCKLFAAPFDVRLFPHATTQKEKGHVQPDLFVVCDKTKRDGKRINGAPDLVIEILSASNESHDRYVKLNLYVKAGVREYWIIDPKNKVIQMYSWDPKHTVYAYSIEDILVSTIFPGLEIPLADIFPNE